MDRTRGVAGLLGPLLMVGCGSDSGDTAAQASDAAADTSTTAQGSSASASASSADFAPVALPPSGASHQDVTAPDGLSIDDGVITDRDCWLFSSQPSGEPGNPGTWILRDTPGGREVVRAVPYGSLDVLATWGDEVWIQSRARCHPCGCSEAEQLGAHRDLLHFDGENWTEMPAPSRGLGAMLVEELPDGELRLWLAAYELSGCDTPGGGGTWVHVWDGSEWSADPDYDSNTLDPEGYMWTAVHGIEPPPVECRGEPLFLDDTWISVGWHPSNEQFVRCELQGESWQVVETRQTTENWYSRVWPDEQTIWTASRSTDDVGALVSIDAEGDSVQHTTHMDPSTLGLHEAVQGFVFWADQGAMYHWDGALHDVCPH